MRRVVPAFALLLAAGCYGAVPAPREATSIGTTSSGFLAHGVALPERGPGFVRARPGEDTRWGTPGLVGALQRAFASVAVTFPGSVPARVGDLSAPGGGRHTRHRSHRTGRDVDVIFYLTDDGGRATSPRGWLAFGRYGHAIEESSGDLFFFDDARNWHFVRTLLLDPEADVQWIFVSRGLKTRLLEYALAHETSAEALVRAAYVLQQPERAAPHDDHFHVRVFCSEQDRASGCRDVGPRWPWLRPEVEAIAGRDGAGLDDASLLAALLDGDDPAAPDDDAPRARPAISSR
ncbi:penicillin-insensitive murein endopeptidase [Sandaracinus amylolyticus]|uniref:penicillin-insensitive murein endopeptidase n=1 Tax=Sandaracinus amylolyticus TaxID=927083 RepID=UPI001EFFD963|nr:penicillin-insensitive murein endopeptidase [Sandaracinus amylolyticus]UJR80168.1 Penicillin-insensitive murein endopeptidase [Sandaracinus amylolyticus]